MPSRSRRSIELRRAVTSRAARTTSPVERRVAVPRQRRHAVVREARRTSSSTSSSTRSRPAVGEDPTLARAARSSRPCSRGDQAAIGELGLERIAFALAGLCDGLTPEEFTRPRARLHGSTRVAPDASGMPLRGNVYQPMLELLDELRELDFTRRRRHRRRHRVRARRRARTSTAYLRNASSGRSSTYDYADEDDRRTLTQGPTAHGGANEGAVKVNNIQTQLGRRPILAAGNSGGDRQMLEWAATGEGADPRAAGRTTTTRSGSSATSAPPRRSPSPSRSPRGGATRLDRGQHRLGLEQGVQHRVGAAAAVGTGPTSGSGASVRCELHGS